VAGISPRRASLQLSIAFKYSKSKTQKCHNSPYLPSESAVIGDDRRSIDARNKITDLLTTSFRKSKLLCLQGQVSGGTPQKAP